MMENNYVFIKKYTSKQSNKEDVLVIFILQETIYLTKAVLKRTSNAIFSMKKVDLDRS